MRSFFRVPDCSAVILLKMQVATEQYQCLRIFTHPRIDHIASIRVKRMYGVRVSKGTLSKDQTSVIVLDFSAQHTVSKNPT